jgi:hypothetical protein
MRVILIKNPDELLAYYQDLENFYKKVTAKYTSQLFGPLLEWFFTFRSEDNTSFSAKRGINFYGLKSVLRSLFFIIIYRDEEIVAFLPLFQFRVWLNEAIHICELISFCPDSTLFFYNDILVKKDCEEESFNAFYEFIRWHDVDKPYVLLLNHIPSTSKYYPMFINYSMGLTHQGFNLSISPVFRRGGIYPWNLSGIMDILEKAKNNHEFSEPIRGTISCVLDAFKAANKTMLIFRQNHLYLKSLLYRIFEQKESSKELFKLYQEIERQFASRPIKYPFLTLPNTADEFRESLSSSKRYYYKRYHQQFIRGSGSFSKIKGKAITSEDINDFIDLHRTRWGKNSNIINRLTKDFIFNYLSKLGSSELLTLFFASHQGRRIACVCCIDFYERREFLSSGRTLAEEKLRSGKLLLYEALLDAIKEGIKVFDFGYGDEAYKADYSYSFLETNVIALFHQLDPKHFINLFPLYEELYL